MEVELDTTDIDSIVKIDVDEGDVLVVTLPESTKNLPRHLHEQFSKDVSKGFEAVLEDKDIKVVVIPYGMKVEYFQASLMKDK